MRMMVGESGEAMASQPDSFTPSLALNWTARTGMPAVRASGVARPERLATEATARAAGASAHARTISPRRAQAGSLRQPVAGSFVDFAIGPIAFPAPAPLTRVFSTPVQRTQRRTVYFWGEGDAQRMRRLVWTHWPMGWRDRVLHWPYQTRRVPIYTTSNPLEDHLT